VVGRHSFAGAGIRTTRPFAKNAKELGTRLTADASEIKSLGHPAGFCFGVPAGTFVLMFQLEHLCSLLCTHWDVCINHPKSNNRGELQRVKPLGPILAFWGKLQKLYVQCSGMYVQMFRLERAQKWQKRHRAKEKRLMGRKCFPFS
jgi:hypothetical protein